MARKKKCALSGTMAEHAVDFQQARHDALEAVQDAKHAMRDGKCLIAGKRIDEGYIAIGRMQASAQGGAELVEASRVQDALEKADDPFEAKCVREKPAPPGMQNRGLGAHPLIGERFVFEAQDLAPSAVKFHPYNTTRPTNPVQVTWLEVRPRDGGGVRLLFQFKGQSFHQDNEMSMARFREMTNTEAGYHININATHGSILGWIRWTREANQKLLVWLDQLEEQGKLSGTSTTAALVAASIPMGVPGLPFLGVELHEDNILIKGEPEEIQYEVPMSTGTRLREARTVTVQNTWRLGTFSKASMYLLWFDVQLVPYGQWQVHVPEHKGLMNGEQLYALITQGMGVKVDGGRVFINNPKLREQLSVAVDELSSRGLMGLGATEEELEAAAAREPSTEDDETEDEEPSTAFRPASKDEAMLLRAAADQLEESFPDHPTSGTFHNFKRMLQGEVPAAPGRAHQLVFIVGEQQTRGAQKTPRAHERAVKRFPRFMQKPREGGQSSDLFLLTRIDSNGVDLSTVTYTKFGAGQGVVKPVAPARAPVVAPVRPSVKPVVRRAGVVVPAVPVEQPPAPAPVLAPPTPAAPQPPPAPRARKEKTPKYLVSAAELLTYRHAKNESDSMVEVLFRVPRLTDLVGTARLLKAQEVVAGLPETLEVDGIALTRGMLFTLPDDTLVVGYRASKVKGVYVPHHPTPEQRAENDAWLAWFKNTGRAAAAQAVPNMETEWPAGTVAELSVISHSHGPVTLRHWPLKEQVRVDVYQGPQGNVPMAVLREAVQKGIARIPVKAYGQQRDFTLELDVEATDTVKAWVAKSANAGLGAAQVTGRAWQFEFKPEDFASFELGTSMEVFHTPPASLTATPGGPNHILWLTFETPLRLQREDGTIVVAHQGRAFKVLTDFWPELRTRGEVRGEPVADNNWPSMHLSFQLKPEALARFQVWLDQQEESGALFGLGAIRKSHDVTSTTAVYKDSETGEYIARKKGEPNADYFTDLMSDAELTALKMGGVEKEYFTIKVVSGTKTQMAKAAWTVIRKRRVLHVIFEAASDYISKELLDKGERRLGEWTIAEESMPLILVMFDKFASVTSPGLMGIVRVRGVDHLKLTQPNATHVSGRFITAVEFLNPKFGNAAGWPNHVEWLVRTKSLTKGLGETDTYYVSPIDELRAAMMQDGRIRDLVLHDKVDRDAVLIWLDEREEAGDLT